MKPNPDFMLDLLPRRLLVLSLLLLSAASFLIVQTAVKPPTLFFNVILLQLGAQFIFLFLPGFFLLETSDRKKLTRFPPFSVFLKTLGLLVFVVLAVILLSELQHRYVDLPRTKETLTNLFKNRSNVELFGLWIVIVIGAPISEEFFFRGCFQATLGGKTQKSKVLAVFGTSLLFGFMHGDLYNLHFYTLLGIFLGWIRQSSDSLWPSIVAHATNNLFAFLMLLFAR